MVLPLLLLYVCGLFSVWFCSCILVITILFCTCIVNCYIPSHFSYLNPIITFPLWDTLPLQTVLYVLLCYFYSQTFSAYHYYCIPSSIILILLYASSFGIVIGVPPGPTILPGPYYLWFVVYYCGQDTTLTTGL